MNRPIMAIMGGALAALISTGAEAATGKWCFQWYVDFSDNGYGEDALTSDTTEPARFAFVSVQQTNPWSDIVTPIFLESNGCTPTMTISPSTTYHFHQYTRAQRSSRDVYVLKDNVGWYSTDTYYEHWSWTTGTYLIPPYVKTFNPHTLVNQTRVMPVVGEMLYWASTLDWTGDNDVWVSFDPDPPTSCTMDFCNGSGGDYTICFESGRDRKFGMAHELGHMISKSQAGPRDGGYEGSEGVFRDPVDGDPVTGDHHCDGTIIEPGGFHSMTTREFTGGAQKEAFSQFIASAAFNDPDDVTGVFVYSKYMMKWSSSHDEALDWPLLLPPYAPAYISPPKAIDLSPGNGDGENVRWVMYECDPSGGDFVHYGTEWDWMELYWNLWVDASNPFSISEIDDVWSDTGDIAYVCCSAHDDNPDPNVFHWIPDLCAPRQMPYACGAGPNYLPTTFIVGKLWEDDADFDVTAGLLDTVRSTYGPGSAKYNLFFNLGGKTKVDY